MSPCQIFNQVPGLMLLRLCCGTELSPQAKPESCVCAQQLGGITLTSLVTLSRGVVVSQCKIKVLLAEEGDMEAGLTSIAEVRCHMHILFSSFVTFRIVRHGVEVSTPKVTSLVLKEWAEPEKSRTAGEK